MLTRLSRRFGQCTAFNILLLMIVFFCWHDLLGDEDAKVDILTTLLEQDRLEEIAARLPEVAQRFPNSPTVLYLQGVLETDAQGAIHYFLKIINEYNNSRFADRATLRVGQYYFAKGNYSNAVKYFRAILNQYPDSKLCGHAAYHETQCYLAQGKVDSTRQLLLRFIQDFQLSPLVAAAIMDLEALEKPQGVEKSFPGLETKPNQKGKTYTVQIGAFQNKVNAMKLVKKAMAMGYDVEGFRKGEGANRVYVVWVGSFPTRNKAEKFAREFKKQNNINYIIVQKPE